jgi:hypothetical protein
VTATLVSDPAAGGAARVNIDMRAHVADLPIDDVHEHHMPGTVDNQEIGLLALLWQIANQRVGFWLASGITRPQR